MSKWSLIIGTAATLVLVAPLSYSALNPGFPCWHVISLQTTLRYVDDANLSNSMKWLVRGSVPIAAILVPVSRRLPVGREHAGSPGESARVQR